MPVSRQLSAALVIALAAAPAFPADAGPHQNCLTKAEQRAAVATHKAISLGDAIRLLGKPRRQEVLRARLCHRGERLVYLLTLLAGNGKVKRATVDAANGSVLSGH